MKKILYKLFCIIVLVGFPACETNNETTLIGKWELQSLQNEFGEELVWKSPSIWEFTKDGKVYVNNEYFSEWSNNGKDLVVELKLYNTDGECLSSGYLYVDKLTNQKLVLLSGISFSSTVDLPCKWIFNRAK